MMMDIIWLRLNSIWKRPSKRRKFWLPGDQQGEQSFLRPFSIVRNIRNESCWWKAPKQRSGYRIYCLLPWVTVLFLLLDEINIGQAWKMCCYDDRVLFVLFCVLQPSLGLQINPAFQVKSTNCCVVNRGLLDSELDLLWSQQPILESQFMGLSWKVWCGTL